MTIRARWAAFRIQRSAEGGYVAVMTALLFVVFLGLAAFAVDVGYWYVVGQQEQRAADAAALAGVTSLPSDSNKAFTVAQNFSAVNGFPDSDPATTVKAELDGGQPTRLRVTVTRTVNNIFGSLLGVPQTTISRTAVADYAGPVAMGSPCNEFGNDPDEGDPTHKSTYCADTGAFWANVGTKGATKQSGDAYQDASCTAVTDFCSGAAGNTDYDQNGYFYTVTVAKDITGKLTFEAFDPAWVAVGDNCTDNGLAGAAGTIYAAGPSSPYCTGDTEIDPKPTPAEVVTTFVVRKEVPTSNPWDPMSYPEVGGDCTKVFQGYKGSLSNPAGITRISQGSLSIGDVFRKWVPLCTIPAVDNTMTTYLIQVKTNGLGNDSNGKSADTASGHNRFSLRAYGGGAAKNKQISIAAYNKMAIYANLPDASTLFYLARVPQGAAGQTLMVRLFDVGDSTDSAGHPINGTITVVPPSDSNVGSNFTSCTGTLSGTTTPAANCSIVASSTTHQGKWQTINVPIPAGYTCGVMTVATNCWVKLSYNYGAGSHPNDTTSWTASIQGDPVRLVQ